MAGGFVASKIAGTTTDQDTFFDVDLQPGHENTNPIELDSSGRAALPIFLLPTGYKFLVYDADMVLQYSLDDIEDVGQAFASNFGTLQMQGSRNVTTGYTQLSTDRFVTVDSSAGTVILNLLPAASMTQLCVFKNLGANPVTVTPNGSDTLENAAATYTVPAASAPNYPTIEVGGDGISAVWIRGSHGL